MRIGRTGLAGMAAVLLATGCSKRDEPPPQEEPIANEMVVPDAPEPAPEPEPAPPKLPDPAANIADLLPPDEPPAPDEQMLEDADAVGLTARAAPAEAEPAEAPAANAASADGL